MVTVRQPARIPFVPLPAGLRDLADVMAFDRMTCRKHPRFRRPIHPAEVPAYIPRSEIGTTVVVAVVRDGVRTRLFDPRHAPGDKEERASI